MSNRFDSFTIDELHTLATSLTNTILKIEDKNKKDAIGSVFAYGMTCIWDADAILHEIADSFKDRELIRRNSRASES